MSDKKQFLLYFTWPVYMWEHILYCAKWLHWEPKMGTSGLVRALAGATVGKMTLDDKDPAMRRAF